MSPQQAHHHSPATSPTYPPAAETAHPTRPRKTRSTTPFPEVHFAIRLLDKRARPVYDAQRMFAGAHSSLLICRSKTTRFSGRVAAGGSDEVVEQVADRGPPGAMEPPMSQRSQRRRWHKKLSRSTGRLCNGRLQREAARLLANLKAEAHKLDPTGEMLGELHSR